MSSLKCSTACAFIASILFSRGFFSCILTALSTSPSRFPVIQSSTSGIFSGCGISIKGLPISSFICFKTAIIFLISECASSNASTNNSSETSYEPDSTIVIPSSCPATTRLSIELFICFSVGLTIKFPPSRPILTAPTGPFQGMPEIASAALAALIPRTLGGKT